MMRLKADLHTHTAEDPADPIVYSAEMLIDAAARLQFRVLAIACHNKCVHTDRLAEYARQRDILLIPAVELMVEGKHVVILNPDERQMTAASFAELRALGRGNGLILAPHPFYPDNGCLHNKLAEFIDIFEAIEFCSLYFPGMDFNRKAVAMAKRHGLPLVGTTDSHVFPYCASTFSWIEAEEFTVEGVLQGIRAGRVSVDTRPRPLLYVARSFVLYLRDKIKRMAHERRPLLRKEPYA